MAEVEAIARVRRQASDLNRQLTDLNRNASQAVSNLATLERGTQRVPMPQVGVGATVLAQIRNMPDRDLRQAVEQMRQFYARPSGAPAAFQAERQAYEAELARREASPMVFDKALNQKRLLGMTEQALTLEMRGQARAVQELDREYTRLSQTRQDMLQGSQEALDTESRMNEVLESRQTALRRMDAAIAQGAQRQRIAGAAFAGVGEMGVGAQLWRGALSGAVGAAGGGGVLGPLLGLSVAGPWGAAAAWGVQQTIGRAAQAYQGQVSFTHGLIPEAVVTGQPTNAILRRVIRMSRAYGGLLSPGDLAEAPMAFGRLTGRRGIRHMADVAALTGGTATDEAQRIGILLRMGRVFEPNLARRLLGQYGGTPAGGNRFLEPFFEGQVGQLGEQWGTPFQAVSPTGLAGILTAATTGLAIPGVDMQGAGGMEAARAYVGAAGTALGGRYGGALFDMQLIAMERLGRNRRLVERLRGPGIGIDIATVPGMLRAIHQAGRLAAQGRPEVAIALQSTFRRYMPPDQLEMMLTGQGVNEDVAHLMATQDMGHIFRGQRAGGAQEQMMLRAWTQEPGVRRVYEADIRPQLLSLEASQDLVSRIGDTIVVGKNELIQALVDTLRSVLSQPVDVSATNPALVPAR